MRSFKTLFEAILAAEETLNSAVMISDARGTEVIFSGRANTNQNFCCFIHDGYDRHMENGKVRMSKRK